MAEKETRTRRSEAERAQESYDKVARKTTAKAEQLERVEARQARLSAELEDLTRLRDWWGSNPLVKAEQD